MSIAAALLSAVIARIEEFLPEKGAPDTCWNDFQEKLWRLVSYLRLRLEVDRLFEGRNDDFSKQVIRLVYEMEDTVEREALVEQHDGVSFQGGIKHLILNGSSQNKLNLPRFTKRIDDLIMLYPKSSSSTIAAGEPRTILPEKSSEVDTVGLEDGLIKLIDKLRGWPFRMSKVAIVGMAGVGKTVLARKLFNHPLVKNHFDIRLWVCVSQESNVITILRSILEDISYSPIHPLSSSLGETELMEIFHKTLSGRTWLVILDDIWSIDVWNRMLHIFPDDNNGSRVVITSRDEGVARRFGGYVYRVPFLTNTESNELLGKKLGLRHSDMNKNASLRSTVNTIISMCQGLPSEIIRIATILKKEKLEDWEKMVHNVQTSEIKETSLLKTIALSYDYLQPHLKPCFLSMGQFPSDQPIPVEKLYSMWKAERFAVLRDTAESYLRELADRNLILVTRKEVLTEELVSYQLQDMTRKLCILKGKEEGFVGIVDSQHGSTSACRAAVYLNGNVKEHDVLSNIHIVKHSRALLFFGDNGFRLLSHWSGMFGELKRFKRARVLDFDGIDLRNSKVSTCKGKLLHLRYLSFARCYLEEFPFSFWIFPFLETLDLRVRTKMIIPNVLWKMSNLLHLYLPMAYECKTQDKLNLEGAKKLEVIENFHVSICDVDNLQQFENLLNLKLMSDGKNTELKKLIGNLLKFRESDSLIKSSLVLKDFDCYSPERQDIFKDLLECGGIQNLYFEGCIRNMPQNLKIAQNFTDIVFDGTEFREDPMPMLGALASLKSLVLCNDAIRVEEILCCQSSFPVLKSLEINNLESLKLWMLESESMPYLTVLKIKNCHNFVTLPEDLVHLDCLRQVNTGSMPQEFKEQIYRLLEKQYEFGEVSVIYEN